VRQLVLQDNVHAIFNGLGTPTHLAVLSFLNSQKIPDVFVASGCDCWNQPTTYPQTFGYQLDYIREGKILGQYVAKHFAGKKIGYFYQDDEFGMDGVKGLDYEIPHSMVVSRQTYVPTNVNIAPQVAALRASGAQVVVAFSIPAFTALLKLNTLKLGYSPTLVVSNVGSDPITLSGLLEVVAYAYTGIGNFVGMRWADWTAGRQVPEDVLDDVLELLARGLAPPAGASPNRSGSDPGEGGRGPGARK
jgi:ABC-type branched-subunit amino acid transport system substrate-binding protein